MLRFSLYLFPGILLRCSLVWFSLFHPAWESLGFLDWQMECVIKFRKISAIFFSLHILPHSGILRICMLDCLNIILQVTEALLLFFSLFFFFYVHQIRWSLWSHSQACFSFSVSNLLLSFFTYLPLFYSFRLLKFTSTITWVLLCQALLSRAREKWQNLKVSRGWP